MRRGTPLSDGPVWAWIETPVGDGLVVLGPRGVSHAAFSAPDGSGMPDEEAVLVAAAALHGELPRHATGALAPVARRVAAWFDGARRDLGAPVDREGLAAFPRAVWEVIAHIPFGETLAYGDVAARAGRPRAARAVGTVCAQVRAPLFLPVHRVTRADGTTGETGAVAPVRRRLLEHEQAVLGRGASPWG